jgi:phosphatidylserine decarboxylase
MRDGAAPGRARVRYRDRASGQMRDETVPGEAPMRWFCETRLGRLCGVPVFGLRLASMLLGCWQQSRWSRRQIQPFIRRFAIDPTEFAVPVSRFRSFNAFFTRRLKPERRPFSLKADVLCAPADGKALVFPKLSEDTDFPLKGARVTAASLMGDPALAAAFAGGPALVIRLAPADYHRFHFVDDGEAEAAVSVPGSLHSVNPIAMCHLPNLFATNKRAFALQHTRQFGVVAQIEIGAFAVGSIVQTFAPGPVQRGQEKGYFQFGGSSLVLLFAPGSATFDPDLVADSAGGTEVSVRAGEPVGVATTA